MTRALDIYTRVSDQGSRADEAFHSHDIQDDKVRKYLDAKNLPANAKTWRENNVSGGKMSRKNLNAILDRIDAGKSGGLAVAYLDRFARTLKEALDIMERIEKAGGVLIALDCDFDTSTAMGKAMMRMALVMSSFQREQGAEKARDTRAFKLQKGETLGGRARLGYTLTDEPSADFEVVQGIRLDFAKGTLKTAYAVAAALNEAGLKTSHGSAWNPRSAKGFLLNASYTGHRHYDGTKQTGGPHFPAAHDEAVQRVIENRLAPKGEKRTRSNGDGFELGHGLLRCDTCGAGMVKNVNALRCSSGMPGHASISYDAAREWVVGLAFSAQGIDNEDFEGIVLSIRSREDYAQAVEVARKAAQKRADEDGVSIEDLPENGNARKALAAAQDALTGFDLSADNEGEPTIVTREAYEALDSMTARRDALRRIVSEVTVLKGTQGQRINGRPLYDRLIVKFTSGASVPAATPERTPLTVIEGSTSESASTAAVA